MANHPLAGAPAPTSILIDPESLIDDYFSKQPQPEVPSQKVSFGTSGHRGTSRNSTFNQNHILAITQAVCDYRRGSGIKGPLFIGFDTHALSKPAFQSAIEVLTANQVHVIGDLKDQFTPTPVISHAILDFNASEQAKADGIIITPSHNPPQDGGFKYNPPDGGPASTSITDQIQNKANHYLSNNLHGVLRIPIEKALRSEFYRTQDFMGQYIGHLNEVIDMDAVAHSGLRIGVDPLGGAGVHYWDPLAEQYGLNLEVVNQKVDPTFSFMHVDHDGKIRMDCSSVYAMKGLIALKDKFDIAFGNDPDTDRHGIVCPGFGLLNPNHYLSVAIDYLFSTRNQWPSHAQIGKTLVSSSMIDRVGNHIGRQVCEVPVGFKWFVEGLLNGSFGFGGEESAGASFLTRSGKVWSTDKDGIILNLLAAEITAKTGKNPGEYYRELTEIHGTPVYERIDTPASAKDRSKLKAVRKEEIIVKQLAGEPIQSILTHAPGNNAPIGGIKVVTRNGWFAARPSGTEDINKLYAESFSGPDHLKQIQEEAKLLLSQI